MFPKTVQRRRKTKIVALIKTWDLAGDGFLIVPDGPVSAGSRKCAAPPHLSGHRASEKYSHNTLHKQRIAVAGLQQSLQEKYISFRGKLAKVKLTKYDTECKSQTPPPPPDSGCQDRVLLCYAAAGFSSWSLVPGSGSPHIIAHHLLSSTITGHLTAQHTPCHSWRWNEDKAQDVFIVTFLAFLFKTTVKYFETIEK